MKELKLIIGNIIGWIIVIIVVVSIGYYFLWFLDSASESKPNYDPYYETDYDLPM